jgi:hypothetical protein
MTVTTRQERRRTTSRDFLLALVEPYAMWAYVDGRVTRAARLAVEKPGSRLAVSALTSALADRDALHQLVAEGRVPALRTLLGGAR